MDDGRLPSLLASRHCTVVSVFDRGKEPVDSMDSMLAIDKAAVVRRRTLLDNDAADDSCGCVVVGGDDDAAAPLVRGTLLLTDPRVPFRSL